MKIDNQANIPTNQLYKLENIYNSILKQTKDLDLLNFKGIRIVEDSLLNSLSDGHFESGIIILPKNKILNYLENENFDILKSTIYHELCHVDLYNKIPRLHKLHKKYNELDNFVKSFTIMIYIEYLAHLKSSKLETIETQTDFFDSVYKLNYDFSNIEHKIYFIKATPYIIGRDINGYYVNKIKNMDFKNRIEEVKKVLIKLPKENLIDDYNILNELEKIVSKYITNDL